MIEEKINFLFMLIEIVFGLIALLIIIWVYGFMSSWVCEKKFRFRQAN
jgi:uncharacterized membrane protein YciS (DUF1049 family)